jgi:hypothetical protein
MVERVYYGKFSLVNSDTKDKNVSRADKIKQAEKLVSSLRNQKGMLTPIQRYKIDQLEAMIKDYYSNRKSISNVQQQWASKYGKERAPLWHLLLLTILIGLFGIYVIIL